MTENFSLTDRDKLHFPSQEEVISLKLQFCSEHLTQKEFLAICKGVYQNIKNIRNYLQAFEPEQIAKLSGHTITKSTLSDSEISSVVEAIKTRWTSPHEFFTVFDIAASKDVYVDEKIESLLGFRSSEFNSAGPEVLDPNLSIYHRDDLFHCMRYALLGYFIFSLPIFKWNSHTDCFHLKFRFVTHRSQLKELRELNEIVVEKRCFLVFEENQQGQNKSRFHYDFYQVHAELELEHVHQNIITKEPQCSRVNALMYLFNASLLQIPPKYILMLDERQHCDRYKVLAKRMEIKMNALKDKAILLEEQQVADCFSKTIRKRIMDSFNVFDKRSKDNKIEIDSDAEAIYYAKKMGILPLPAAVRELYYKLVR